MQIGYPARRTTGEPDMSCTRPAAGRFHRTPSDPGGESVDQLLFEVIQPGLLLIVRGRVLGRHSRSHESVCFVLTVAAVLFEASAAGRAAGVEVVVDTLGWAAAVGRRTLRRKFGIDLFTTIIRG
jgi:hypothetical protein